MRYGILGNTRAWRSDGSEVPLGGPARRALLALLLIRPGETVSADRIIDLLYGEQPPGNAQHAVQSQVSRLRGDGIPVERTAAGYRLQAGPDEVDAQRFLSLATAGRQALESDPGRAAELLREALGLWRGDALADLGEAHAVPLEERRLAAREDLVEADLRRGEHRAAIPELTALIEAHPLRERLRGQLMRALRADGRQAEALVAYEETRRLLADELGADPSPELAELHRALLRGDAQASRPAGRLTSFVGRDADLAGISDLLSSARLVTLLGPGGAGKTRLAVEATRHRHDVWPAELAAAREGDDLARAVLVAIGVRGGTGIAAEESTPFERLVAALSDGPALLVMDNCEQVIADAAELAERLLNACPRLRILATSREPLGIPGEHLYPVGPLADSDAIRLFADRAGAVRRGFEPDATVARICAALDGLPLAIELAAARMRTHEPAELADRLAEQDRFLLLSRGSRTADARHQTLRAVVQWSWDLLPEAEREMAARLAVFAGGATAADAAAVCGLPDAEDLLDSLADKSLVEVAGGRYRMLETIRAFCAEQADLDPVRQAHATRFLTLAEQADPRLRGGEQLEWLARLSAEHGNLQAALRWSVESGQVTLGMRLVAAQMTYLWMRGLRVAVVAPAAALLDLAGAEPDPALGDAYVLCALATVFDPAGRPAWERHRATAERMLLDRAGVRHPVVALLWPMVVAGQSDPEVALSVLQQAGQAEDPWERAVTPLLWGYPRLSAGEFELAEQEFRTALGRFRALGDRWGSGLALDSLAWLAATRGDREVAVARVNEAIVFAEQLGAEEDQADLLCNRGDYGSDPAGRTADYERAAVLARRTGSRTDLACALRGLGDVARLSGDLERARQLYGQALELVDRRWIKALSNYARLMVGIGRIAEADGDPGAALAAYSGAVESAVTTGGISEGARGVEALARLALPDARRAAALLGAATVVRGVAVLEEPELAVRVRAILGDEAFEAEYARGAGLSKLDALRLAGVSEQVIAASPLQVMAR